jgi:hypothetical protein
MIKQWLLKKITLSFQVIYFYFTKIEVFFEKYMISLKFRGMGPGRLGAHDRQVKTKNRILSYDFSKK